VPDDVKPTPAEHRDGSVWEVALPTQELLGSYTVLINCTDVAGNTAGFPVEIQVESLEAEQQRQQAARATLSGVVTYRGERIPGASLELKGADATQPILATTNDRGEFLYRNVEPGQYSLVSRSVVLNVPRRSEQSVDVTADATGPVVVDMVLR
jgi:hypothetical protein